MPNQKPAGKSETAELKQIVALPEKLGDRQKIGAKPKKADLGKSVADLEKVTVAAKLRKVFADQAQLRQNMLPS